MHWTQIATNYWVSPQIDEQEVAMAANEGFEVIVCNRPDNEAPDQINSDIIQAATEKAGMKYVFLPMVGANFTQDYIDVVKQLHTDEKKVLAYCRSGNRSSILFNAAIS
ncbi:MAG: TIGR01244 family sulfur transferase [Reinekea sp.]